MNGFFPFLRKWLLPALVLLLPWQAVWVLTQPVVHDTVWDLGSVRVFVVPVLFLCVGLVYRERFFRLSSKAVFGILLVLLIGVFSALFAEQTVLAAQQLLLWFSLTVLGVLLFTASREEQRLLVWAFLITMSVQAVLALVQVGLQQVWGSTLLGVAAQDPSHLGTSVVEVGDQRRLRAFGTFPHPNIAGAWFGAAFLLVFPQAKRFKRPVWASFALLFFGAALLATFSRSAFLATTLAVSVFLGVCAVHVGKKEALRLLKPLLPLLLFGVVVLIAFWPIVQTRLGFGTRLEQLSVSERVLTLQNGWEVLVQHPLFGAGLAQSTVVLHQLQPDLSGYLLQPPHIALFALVVELGVVGTLVFLLGCWLLVSGRKKSLMPVLPAVVFLLTISCFDHFLYTLWPGLALLVTLPALLTARS